MNTTEAKQLAQFILELHNLKQQLSTIELDDATTNSIRNGLEQLSAESWRLLNQQRTLPQSEEQKQEDLASDFNENAENADEDCLSIAEQSRSESDEYLGNTDTEREKDLEEDSVQSDEDFTDEDDGVSDEEDDEDNSKQTAVKIEFEEEEEKEAEKTEAGEEGGDACKSSAASHPGAFGFLALLVDDLIVDLVDPDPPREGAEDAASLPLSDDSGRQLEEVEACDLEDEWDKLSIGTHSQGRFRVRHCSGDHDNSRNNEE